MIKKLKLFFSLLLIFEISTTPLSSTEWYESEAIFTAIGRDLSDICLEPFIKGDEQAAIRVLGRETSLDYLLSQGVAFIAGTLTQRDSFFNIMLMALWEPISKDIKVSLLYLSKESMPSAQLVLDVYRFIQSSSHLFSRREREASQFPVFIEPVEKRQDSLLTINKARHAVKEARYEKWTFLSQERTQAFYVTSAFVKEGGTDFVVEIVE